MKDFAACLEDYAMLGIRLGVNLQPGQPLVIDAPIFAAEFAHLLAEQGYRSGAKAVHILWSDPELERLQLLNGSPQALHSYQAWRQQIYGEMMAAKAAFFTVLAPRPGLFDDVPAERTHALQTASLSALGFLREAKMRGQVSWSGLAIPTTEWANQVFSAEEPAKRIAGLWEALFRVTRVYEADPLRAWQGHLRDLHHRCAVMNTAQYRALRYDAPGTNLIVQLPHRHIWSGGGRFTEDGVFIVPNLPTEEVFTAPLRTGVNGTVKGTRPFIYAEQVIDEFTLTFKEGRVIECRAERGLEALKALLASDEGAAFLGEIALVPNRSPVSQEGLIFYHPLFDENASCHLALGSAYPTSVEEGPSLTKEQLVKRGINSSMIHVDFMMGSEELSVHALTEAGDWIPLLEHGEWVAATP
ncbi:aminopeptidase [Alicyclobacillus hesperidum]|uniref:aminopeptidase n=1 Tax=Alicyclobacillus hesperidum TaxID=89784 RepID=UPI00248F4D84|nr:aminopeptidase [Alicyclobacillus hesperidum]